MPAERYTRLMRERGNSSIYPFGPQFSALRWSAQVVSLVDSTSRSKRLSVFMSFDHPFYFFSKCKVKYTWIFGRESLTYDILFLTWLIRRSKVLQRYAGFIIKPFIIKQDIHANIKNLSIYSVNKIFVESITMIEKYILYALKCVIYFNEMYRKCYSNSIKCRKYL